MIGIVRSKRISDGDGIRLPNISVVFDDQNGGMRMEVCVHWSNLGTPPMVAQDFPSPAYSSSGPWPERKCLPLGLPSRSCRSFA